MCENLSKNQEAAAVACREGKFRVEHNEYEALGKGGLCFLLFCFIFSSGE